MSERVTISTLEVENLKRVKAVRFELTSTGLNVIGGNNNQGKTSILDAIIWGLGGNKFRPSNPQREGSLVPPNIKITLSNGLTVERKGKNSDLKVTDPTGKKSGQSLLDEFIEELALNLPKFTQASSKEKADSLLSILGLGDRLHQFDQEIQSIYNERLAIGRIADQKAKFAKEMPFHPEAPKDLISPSELIRQQQEILARNGANAKLRQQRAELEGAYDHMSRTAEELKRKLDEVVAKRNELLLSLETARKSTEDLHDESTEELEQNIANIELINAKVRDNLSKEKAEEEAKMHQDTYAALTAKLDSARMARLDLLKNADLPLEGLSIDQEGELIYKDARWDCMSGSDQLKVSTAIVRKLKPQCGFIILDKLEQMDIPTLNEFGKWLEEEGLQVIGTRVSTGEECSIIIEDGYVAGADQPAEVPAAKTWTEGAF